MKEHIYLRQRNEAIRRLRFEEGKSGKEVAAALREKWPEINVWIVYRVAKVSQEANSPNYANQKDR